MTADSVVGPSLKALRVLLYANHTVDHGSPSRVQSLDLTRTALPLSFGITRGGASSFTLVVQGCADSVACADVLVEQRALVRFQARRTTQLDILLTQACAGPARCPELRSTCAPLTTPEREAGSCVALAENVGAVIQPSDELFPTIPAVTLGPTSERDASLPKPPDEAGIAPDDAGIQEPVSDASVGDASASADAMNSDAAAPPGVCSEPTVCAAEYPCSADRGAGFVCTGQFADWPMPDALPGARVSPSYEVAGDTVRDRITGLLWQRNLPTSSNHCTGAKSAAGDRCSFEEARAYCASLRLADRAWRVPSKIELESLLDFRPGAELRGLDPAIFSIVPQDFHWTASIFATDKAPNQAWVVDLFNGYSGMVERNTKAVVRCVSSDPVEHVEARYDERPLERVIADRRTQLVWSTYIPCDARQSSAEAASFCANMPGGFRLPSLKELLTVIDPTRVRPSAREELGGHPEEDRWFWSSTPTRDGREGHWLASATAGVTVDEANLSRVAEPTRLRHCTLCVR